MCILVVDDEPLVCDSVADFLRSEGFLVVKSYDVHHALDLAKQLSREIQAVITDLKMPKMNGIEMWQQMKDIVRPDCRIVFMSGNAEGYLVGGVQLPGEFLQKPFSFDLLTEKLSGIDPESD